MLSKQDPKLMMAAKKESEIWLYSYADLITNLLAFFIMLLVMSKGGTTAQKIQESISKVVTGAGPGTGREDMNNEISEIIKTEHLENNIALETTLDGSSLTFSGGLFFESSSAELTPAAKQMLTQIIPVFTKVGLDRRIDIEGHTDSRPIQSSSLYKSNWELSSARAGAVVRYLAEQGIDSRQMRAIGYADTRPISNEYQENRRVVITIGRRLK